MATAKSRKSASKSRKSGTRPRAQAAQARPANKAFAYADRIPILRDVLQNEHAGSATVAELFKTVKTGKSGEFATERRVAATLRYDARADAPAFERDGTTVTLRKRNRAASKRKSGNVSRKKTRAAK